MTNTQLLGTAAVLVGHANESPPKSAKRSNLVGAEDCTPGGASVPGGGTATPGGASVPTGSPAATGACVVKLAEVDAVTDGR